MSTYTPDSWVILEINSNKNGKIYKVLAGWGGGYLSGDSWKVSSGIESVQQDDGAYTMPQSSGSVYVLHKNSERMSGYTMSIFASLQEQAEQPDSGFTIKVIEVSELLEALKA